MSFTPRRSQAAEGMMLPLFFLEKHRRPGALCETSAWG